MVSSYLQSERGLSIAGMYIHSRRHHSRGLSIAGMYIHIRPAAGDDDLNTQAIEFIILNTKSIIFNEEFIIFNEEFISC